MTGRPFPENQRQNKKNKYDEKEGIPVSSLAHGDPVLHHKEKLYFPDASCRYESPNDHADPRNPDEIFDRIYFPAAVSSRTGLSYPVLNRSSWTNPGTEHSPENKRGDKQAAK
jgi:hypothetical protein